jgi:hypothetical protein
MIQRIQSIFMFLLALINIILIISVDSDPPVLFQNLTLDIIEYILLIIFFQKLFHSLF